MGKVFLIYHSCLLPTNICKSISCLEEIVSLRHPVPLPGSAVFTAGTTQECLQKVYITHGGHSMSRTYGTHVRLLSFSASTVRSGRFTKLTGHGQALVLISSHSLFEWSFTSLEPLLFSITTVEYPLHSQMVLLWKKRFPQAAIYLQINYFFSRYLLQMLWHSEKEP